MDNPLNDPASDYSRAIHYIDIGTTAVFVVEIFMKIIAYGLIFNGKFSYLRSI